ncbi:MAG: hypothetical protein Q8O33_06465 [Pseudomonadota bacterium]|nr:hypothetical protein [Pseudomonadota bacterium]
MSQTLNFTLQPRLDQPLPRADITRLFLAFGETAERVLDQRSGTYLGQTLRAIEASTDLDLSELITLVDNALDGTEGLTSHEIAKEIAWHPSRVDARLASIGLQYRHAEGQWRATQFGKPLVIDQEAQGPRWNPAILSFFTEVV